MADRDNLILVDLVRIDEMPGTNRRIDRVEFRLDRIERRLDLAEAH